MSALGQKPTYELQQAMSALPPIATAKADMCLRSCLLYPRKRTCAVQKGMSALPPIATAKADITLAQLSGFLPFPAHGFMQHNTGIIGQFWKPSRVNIEATAWP